MTPGPVITPPIPFTNPLAKSAPIPSESSPSKLLSPSLNPLKASKICEIPGAKDSSPKLDANSCMDSEV